jgi:hypothetical protein
VLSRGQVRNLAPVSERREAGKGHVRAQTPDQCGRKFSSLKYRKSCLVLIGGISGELSSGHPRILHAHEDRSIVCFCVSSRHDAAKFGSYSGILKQNSCQKVISMEETRISKEAILS